MRCSPVCDDQACVRLRGQVVKGETFDGREGQTGQQGAELLPDGRLAAVRRLHDVGSLDRYSGCQDAQGVRGCNQAGREVEVHAGGSGRPARRRGIVAVCNQHGRAVSRAGQRAQYVGVKQGGFEHEGSFVVRGSWLVVRW